MTASTSRPHITIIIPVYNEAAIVADAVEQLLAEHRRDEWRIELLLAENGSTDATPQILAELCERHPEVRWFSYGSPNYGAALRQAILQASSEFVICEEIDLCDVAFHRQAIAMLIEHPIDLIIGSKLLPGARDDRPLGRHFASVIYNRSLGLLLGFSGTDTHGLKAFRRDRLRAIADACVVDRDVFASEFVIRAHRAGLDVREVAVTVREKRTPSVGLFRRVPNVLKSLVRLTWAVRLAPGTVRH